VFLEYSHYISLSYYFLFSFFIVFVHYLFDLFSFYFPLITFKSCSTRSFISFFRNIKLLCNSSFLEGDTLKTSNHNDTNYHFKRETLKVNGLYAKNNGLYIPNNKNNSNNITSSNFVSGSNTIIPEEIARRHRLVSKPKFNDLRGVSSKDVPNASPKNKSFESPVYSIGHPFNTTKTENLNTVPCNISDVRDNVCLTDKRNNSTMRNIKIFCKRRFL